MRRLIRVVPVLTALALIAAGCGSDKKSNETSAPSTAAETTAAPTSAPEATTAGTATQETTGTTATTGATETTAAAGGSEMMDVVKSDPLTGKAGSGLTRGITDTSVKLGCVYAASNYAGMEDGIKARFQRANDAGGVNGRKIDFTGCQDSTGDPTQIQSLYKQAVEQDEVFGLITLDATIPQAAFDYLNENEVPYTGWGYLPGFCGTRWGFGWNGCIGGTQLTQAVPHAVNQLNLVKQTIDAAGMKPADTKVYVQLDDGPAGKGNQQTFTLAAEEAGATVVGSKTDIPVAAPPSDFTPFVQEAIGSGANFVIVATAFGDVGGYTATLKAAGFKGAILNYTAYIPGLLQTVPALAQAIDGSYVSTQVLPQEQQTPFVKQMEADLTASQAKNGSFITFGAGLGYYQADLWLNLLTAAGKDLDTKTFDQAVNVQGTTSDTGFDGSIGVTTWPQMHFLPTDCAAVVQVAGTEFKVVEEFACFESVRLR